MNLIIGLFHFPKEVKQLVINFMIEKRQITNNETRLYLKEGLNAVLMPELRNRKGVFEELDPTFASETVRRLQIFLDEIQNQGGEILAVVPVQVRIDPEDGMRENFIEDRQIFIIKK